jgi:hypothetical protein
LLKAELSARRGFKLRQGFTDARQRVECTPGQRLGSVRGEELFGASGKTVKQLHQQFMVEFSHVLVIPVAP